ncbi:MAG: hypothetical protein LBC86_10555 [Oscillospiraceae bacterium]|jgi:plasmid stability protein|nr:hypothetical protein [Oscillospiraceae bacterium]
MTKSRLNTDEAFKSIIGDTSAEVVKTEEKPPEKAAAIKPVQTLKPIQDKFIQTTIYLTKQQQKALKLRAAMSDRAEDKDISAIVRTALNLYLADTLKQVQT